MSNDRTTVSVKRDHIALLNTLFRLEGGVYVTQPEVFFATPNMTANIGNMLGAMNRADSEQYPPPGAPSNWNPPTEVHANVWHGTHVWGDSRPYLTAKAEVTPGDDPRMFGDKWLIFAVTVPETRANNVMHVNCAEWPIGQAARHLTVSRYPGDFREADPTGVNGPFKRSHGNTVNVDVSVGKELIVGETYYVNIRNWSMDLQEYGVGKLELLVQFNWPRL